jgi:hypothetical protein
VLGSGALCGCRHPLRRQRALLLRAPRRLLGCAGLGAAHRFQAIVHRGALPPRPRRGGLGVGLALGGALGGGGGGGLARGHVALARARLALPAAMGAVGSGRATFFRLGIETQHPRA